MSFNILDIIKKPLMDQELTAEEALAILERPSEILETLFEVAGTLRRRYRGLKVYVQAIASCVSGDCGEDCAYCAQSSDSLADIEKRGLLDEDVLLEKSRLLSDLRVDRHCLGFSGLRFTDEEIAIICERIARFKARIKTAICCSIGFLTLDQARALKDAGVDRVNHNLNSSARFYPEICSTHAYSDRIKNLRTLKEAGLELCCGGIVGMGEEKADVVDMLMTIRELNPASVPINFYVPVPGTVLAARGAPNFPPEYLLSVLGLARLLFPKAEIRCAAGREKYLSAYTSYVLTAADSIFVEGYLTVGGENLELALSAIRKAGFEARLS
jgi:biotin synthase